MNEKRSEFYKVQYSKKKCIMKHWNWFKKNHNKVINFVIDKSWNIFKYIWFFLKLLFDVVLDWTTFFLFFVFIKTSCWRARDDDFFWLKAYLLYGIIFVKKSLLLHAFFLHNEVDTSKNNIILKWRIILFDRFSITLEVWWLWTCLIAFWNWKYTHNIYPLHVSNLYVLIYFGWYR